jgi:hypothetical protein
MTYAIEMEPQMCVGYWLTLPVGEERGWECNVVSIP